MAYDRIALRKHHSRWLKKLDYRCQLTGKIIGKSHKGRYRRYNFHHTSSDAYTREIPGYNYILLSPLAHGFVHNVLGGAIGGDLDVTIQNRRARRLPLPWLWRYPNPLQKVFHFWCRLPFSIRWFTAWVGIIWAAIDLAWVWYYGA